MRYQGIEIDENRSSLQLKTTYTCQRSIEALLEKELAPFRHRSTSELYIKAPPTLLDVEDRLAQTFQW